MRSDPAPQGLRGQEAPHGETRREVTSFYRGQGCHLRGGVFVLSLEEEVSDKKWKKGIQEVITM